MEKTSEGGAVVTANPVAGGSFSQLLLSEEDDQLMHHSTSDDGFNFTSPFYSTDEKEKPPKMLCFGDYGGDLVFNNDFSKTTSKSCTTDSSSPSSTNNANYLPNSNRKRSGCNENQPVVQCLSTGTGAPARSQRNSKKARTSENGGHAKVKKERLGERIAALQQLVSPFGKTDTASVLHEAMGYIKFLQAQVQVLCSPYLLRLPSNSSKSPPLPGCEENVEGELKSRKDLRSRGLCLVPVDRTLLVAESNGADFWSPATIKNGSLDH